MTRYSKLNVNKGSLMSLTHRDKYNIKGKLIRRHAWRT